MYQERRAVRRAGDIRGTVRAQAVSLKDLPFAVLSAMMATKGHYELGTIKQFSLVAVLIWPDLVDPLTYLRSQPNIAML
jgi:hypothetical protein